VTGQNGGLPDDGTMRDLVREVLREVLPTLSQGRGPAAPVTPPTSVPAASPRGVAGPPLSKQGQQRTSHDLPAPAAKGQPGAEVRVVRVGIDEELRAG
jgi:hypothetical protein